MCEITVWMGTQSLCPLIPGYLLHLLQTPLLPLHLQVQLGSPSLGLSYHLLLLHAGALSLIPCLCQQPNLLLQMSKVVLLWAQEWLLHMKGSQAELKTGGTDGLQVDWPLLCRDQGQGCMVSYNYQ